MNTHYPIIQFEKISKDIEAYQSPIYHADGNIIK